jgi:hypothetical protein
MSGIQRYNQLANSGTPENIVAKKLVWLEKQSFAAWGCEGCNWIFQNVRATVSRKPSRPALEAFAKHDCVKFPRYSSATEKRPPRGCGL